MAGGWCPAGAQISDPRFVARKDAQPKESSCRLSRAEDAASGEAGRRDAGRSGSSHPRREGGQAAVELALALPLLALLALGLLQVGLVVRDQLVLTHAAREAAREAALDDDRDAGRRGALSGSRLDPDRLEVTTRGRRGPGSRVTATLTYRSPTDVPLVGRLVGDVRLQASVTMRVEM